MDRMAYGHGEQDFGPDCEHRDTFDHRARYEEGLADYVADSMGAFVLTYCDECEEVLSVKNYERAN